MAVIAGEHQAVRKPVAAPRIQPGPQNVGLPGYRPGDAGNPYQGINNPAINPQAIAGYQPPAPPAPPAPVAPPPVAPGINWDDVVNDPQYLRGAANLDDQNRINVGNINRDYAMWGQQNQDSYNGHGGLFSGAFANSQNNLVGPGGAQERALYQQTVTNKTSHDDLHQKVWDRLTAPGGLIGGTL